MTEVSDVRQQATTQEDQGDHKDVETFGGGRIRVRHGRINGWLVAVYAILFLWAVYYGFVYWGGLGPGLDY